ncbi:LytTR family DNA-binding domain-containing protein [uncultured Psychroserpens sp.]|uniref:LytR/AlgR family response regulator transcription factor n=1 Tax=uncultured Psychroserpens sp. TaxID=255436 RepID=UPI00261CFD2F|nr:LytTR family DNA-binding domain-containing protein [uncultured Psychroserpens sp.]
MSKYTINSIIIEDDSDAVNFLNHFLEINFNKFKINGVAKNVGQAIHLIDTLRPELIFADIELLDGTIFDVLKSSKYQDFEIIFITGHNQYLKKAMDHFAFYFIDKPIDEIILSKTLHRYLKLKERLYTLHKFQFFNEFIHEKKSKIILDVGRNQKIVKIDSIIKCVADGNHTKFYTDNNETFLAQGSLKHFEDLLIRKEFLRIHRSVLVNLSHVLGIQKKSKLLLSNNMEEVISVRNRSQILNQINLFLKSI